MPVIRNAVFDVGGVLLRLRYQPFAVTATFRLLYVFVVIEHGSRRLVRARSVLGGLHHEYLLASASA